ncbi:MAG: hypothetical protein ACRDO2_12565, partial [Nocardioidaceae bacterium]
MSSQRLSGRSRRAALAVVAATATAAAGLAAISSPAATGATAGAAAAPAGSPFIDLQLLSFNDYHGHLQPPAGSDGNLLKADGTTIQAGGVEDLTTHLKQLREGHPNTLTVAAGDLIGGSPFLSGLFKDEPSVETLNTLGLDVSSVGNHEFDEG